MFVHCNKFRVRITRRGFQFLRLFSHLDQRRKRYDSAERRYTDEVRRKHGRRGARQRFALRNAASCRRRSRLHDVLVRLRRTKTRAPRPRGQSQTSPENGNLHYPRTGGVLPYQDKIGEIESRCDS